ncbi:hypothetical protein [Modestobacter marinus]|uniref:hypothetical protein n=1 Tax=Modestobacter marinus TaxID=477641 RepID=UPI001C9632C0|nr:hypothetical protein [Modestobacter marinus]
MGRHTADDGAGVHPIVAAALQQRVPQPEDGGPRHVSGQGGLGWPGDPAEGTGLGWPAGTEAEGQGAVPAASQPVEQSPARHRSVWQRLFAA